MAYRALEKMKEKNKIDFGIDGTVSIPELPACNRMYGRNALEFLRDWCEDLKFDPNRADLTDADGRSIGIGQIPFNMECDLDRLSFERALGRFLESGSREDAFDIYYCYCEIFHPFGGGYQETGILLKMLSEHEYNASSLLMKHRDHYSHSVYVFCIGLAVYMNHKAFRDAYNRRFGLTEKKKAACHFLEYWGLTSLFHDIGYPFEIAHQQMKAYICNLDKSNNNDKLGYTPYISYKGMELFCQSRAGDLNDLFAQIITDRMAIKYLSRTTTEPYLCRYKLREALKDRAVHDNPASMDYLYMDHAYFSGLILAKTYLEHKKHIEHVSQIPEPVLDSLCAIMLHNSLFKFTMRKFLNTKEPLRLSDGQPLAYLLMLCDELQCWDRASYGKDTRRKIYAFDFDMTFLSEQTMKLEYFYDKNYENRSTDQSNYENMRYKCMYNDSSHPMTKITPEGRCKFLDDIDDIVALVDVIPQFTSDRKKGDYSEAIKASFEKNTKSRRLTLSDSNYLSLYNFAMALHGRYSGTTPENMEEDFENNLSLEYKLSNIAQARRYASVLGKIRCFYTNRAVDFDPVMSFTDDELKEIAKEEHELWMEEKVGMGWQHGTAHLSKPEEEQKKMRERTRMHDVLVAADKLPNNESDKSKNAMTEMLNLLYSKDGLTIYRLPYPIR